MPKFPVLVSGEGIDQAMAALEAEGIETTLEPRYAYGMAPGETGEARIVIVESESAEAAKRRVEEILPNHIVRDAGSVSEP